MKEPEITLFGRKIVLPENGGGDESSDESDTGSGGVVDYDQLSEREIEKADDDERQLHAQEDQVAEEQPSETKPPAKEPQDNPIETSELDDNPKTPSIDEDAMSEDHPNTEQSDPTDGKQKTLKKPDKILPCPRCNSMETKFCYYNNYNVNQPRHFCKSCQRYWTAGGTMRNVPVGAGRRKNKNSATHCHHITISEALQAARVDAPNGYHNNHLAFKPNGTVLSFGPDQPVFQSAVPGLNLADKRATDGVANGHHKIDKGSSVSCKNGENGSFVTKPDSVCDGAKNGAVMHNMNGFPCPVPCIPGVPWPFAWNSPVPLPAICPPPGYPMPFYPAPYWGCGMPNPWNVPWLSTQSPTANQKGANSSPNSPLGKHARDGELIKPNDSEDKEQGGTKENNSIVVPKTLRIDDPEEAAKSSIWETLGIKYDSISREGLFKALQPKGDEKKLMVSASPVLQANPAALSRSINFQEGA